ncbi:plastocyanin/azurin family copper-binding protein [Sphingobium sp. Sx8-8]|uniref:plastocyanin/azurin family copper-binding protein n=1 Tax=Sphingobium sp. Sx8-8 TaxID=2933617 RepID=UPI001F570532|nr:plastocyanin/azurin family copper-binding protein [Sphingobium sp. Sx8-8]
MSHVQWPAILAALILASTAGAQPEADNWSGARLVTIRLSSFRFEPADIVLEHGRPYRFHFVNDASGGHDFAGKEFFAQARIKPEDAAKVEGGRVELSGGESVDVRLIAPLPGQFKIRCTHFMHSMLGMTGRIVVQ